MSYEMLKNPIVLGIITAVIVYGYLYYERYTKQEALKTQGQPVPEESISFYKPAIAGVVVWFLAVQYFSAEEEGDYGQIEGLEDEMESVSETGSTKGSDINDIASDVATMSQKIQASRPSQAGMSMAVKKPISEQIYTNMANF
jgi:hypothetical protein